MNPRCHALNKKLLRNLNKNDHTEAKLAKFDYSKLQMQNYISK